MTTMTETLSVPPLAHDDESLRREAQAARDSSALDRIPVLPEAFWAARPVLGSIRQFARAAPAPPDAVMAAVLGELSLRTDYRFMLANIGSTGNLNLVVCLVAPSGTGKGTALATASRFLGDRLPMARYRYGSISPGSAEGLVKHFYEKVPRLGWLRAYEGLMVAEPEGERLNNLAKRPNSSLLATLRKAWSGEQLGGAHSTVDANLTLPAHSYRLSVVIGLQPVAAAFLLDDMAGMLQRVIWLGVADPTLDLDQTAEIPRVNGGSLVQPVLWAEPDKIYDTLGDPRVAQLSLRPRRRPSRPKPIASAPRRLRCGPTGPDRPSGPCTRITKSPSLVTPPTVPALSPTRTSSEN